MHSYSARMYRNRAYLLGQILNCTSPGPVDVVFVAPKSNDNIIVCTYRHTLAFSSYVAITFCRVLDRTMRLSMTPTLSLSPALHFFKGKGGGLLP